MTTIIQDTKALKQISEPATQEEAHEIIKKLEETLSRYSHGIGLSAIQIGIPRRIFVIKRQNEGELPSFDHYINPEVVDMDGEFTFSGEGCLSYPGLYLNTKRHHHYTIKRWFFDKGKYQKEMDYFYFPEYYDEHISREQAISSIAVQHEMYHLDGEVLPEYGFKNQPIRINKKIGRNEPCPCGSGKKYKKCCESLNPPYIP
jgi:peptide deformylase